MMGDVEYSAMPSVNEYTVDRLERAKNKLEYVKLEIHTTVGLERINATINYINDAIKLLEGRGE